MFRLIVAGAITTCALICGGCVGDGVSSAPTSAVPTYEPPPSESVEPTTEVTEPPVTATVTSTSAAAGPARSAELHRYWVAARAGHFFRTPSGKFYCAIFAASPTSDHVAAGCHGKGGILPPTLPEVRGMGGEMVRPNTVQSIDGETGTIIARGDPAYQAIDGPPAVTLLYDTPLTANGYTCTVTETTGITCRHDRTHHGFTVADTGATLF